MVQRGTKRVAFKGKLLKRSRLTGKPVLQLVFRDAGKNWLCLSSNLANLKLQIGKEYRVEGPSRMLGDRSYIHDPQITAIGGVSALKRLTFSTAIVLVVATMTAFAVKAMNGNLAPTSAESTEQKKSVTHESDKNKQAANAEEQEDVAPVTESRTDTSSNAAGSASRSGGSTATPATNTPAPAPNPTPAPTPPPPPPQSPEPYCDPPEVVTFEHQTVIDDAQPEGTVVQVGEDGQRHTCYSGVSGEPGLTLWIKEPINQITTVHSAPQE